ncbi:hypothetical protein JKP88DRAFT_248817 [Tribonema minus]|uniref:Uncharacterized protein n=1 Tax=Tribonema minus TaxID=303371 RepID=A0A835YMP7_9STRA|nr:hypothetical protein JKP88DRAFT_248817 [Tribonema minus]
MKLLLASCCGSRSVTLLFVRLIWASMILTLASSARTPLDCSFDELTNGDFVVTGDLSCHKDLSIQGAVNIFVQEPATISGLRLDVRSGATLIVSGQKLTLTAPKGRKRINNALMYKLKMILNVPVLCKLQTADDNDIPIDGGALNLVHSTAIFKNHVIFKDNMAYFGGALAGQGLKESNSETSSPDLELEASVRRSKLTFEAPVVFSGNQAGMSDTSQAAVMYTLGTDVVFQSPVLFVNNTAPG